MNTRRNCSTDRLLFSIIVSTPLSPSLSLCARTGKYDFEWGDASVRFHGYIRRGGGGGGGVHIHNTLPHPHSPAKDWLEAGQLAATQSVISFFLNPPSCLTLCHTHQHGPTPIVSLPYPFTLPPPSPPLPSHKRPPFDEN